MTDPREHIQLRNPWHLLATGFGSGLSPIVPGTMGTVAAIPFYMLMTQLPFTVYLAITFIAAIIGITICQKTSDDMQVHDHGSIVWDEFVGFWITMAIAPALSWEWVLTGFILFRFST